MQEYLLYFIKESFNATLDIMIPKNMSGKIGLFPGTKYCINKVYWRYFLTMLCPPAGVFMSYGLRGWVQILICCVLSLLYYIPGLIYAIIVMNRSDVIGGLLKMLLLVLVTVHHNHSLLVAQIIRQVVIEI